jgi:NAD(P)H-dependent FMN reductase
MSDQKLKLAVIIGSVRNGRFGPVVTQWFVEQATQHGQFSVDVIDLVETPLPLALPPEPPAYAPADFRPAEMAGLTAKLAAADAVVVVTPEYNHSFPAALKSAIDWHFSEWQAKPIGFVSYGGAGGGVRAVEQLRLIFTELHAVTVRDSPSFPKFWELFGPDGQLVAPEEPNASAKAMLDQLLWWGQLLHDARATHPYTVAG